MKKEILLLVSEAVDRLHGPGLQIFLAAAQIEDVRGALSATCVGKYPADMGVVGEFRGIPVRLAVRAAPHVRARSGSTVEIADQGAD